MPLGLNNDAGADYNNLFDDLASWGYVTISHYACQYGCNEDTKSLWWDPPFFGNYYRQQLLAIDWALDNLETELEAQGILLDTSNGVGVAAHSMGGQSALFASSYNNITATKVPITAAVLHHAFSHEFPAPQVPFIAFTGEEDFIAPPSMSKQIFNSTKDDMPLMTSRGYANKASAGHLENEDWENAGLVSDWYNPLIPQFTAAWFKLHLEMKNAKFGFNFEEMIYGGGETSICNGGDGVIEECVVLDCRADGVLSDAVSWWGILSEHEKKLVASVFAGGGVFVFGLLCLFLVCKRKAMNDRVSFGDRNKIYRQQMEREMKGKAGRVQLI